MKFLKLNLKFKKKKISLYHKESAAIGVDANGHGIETKLRH